MISIYKYFHLVHSMLRCKIEQQITDMNLLKPQILFIKKDFQHFVKDTFYSYKIDV